VVPLEFFLALLLATMLLLHRVALSTPPLPDAAPDSCWYLR